MAARRPWVCSRDVSVRAAAGRRRLPGGDLSLVPDLQGQRGGVGLLGGVQAGHEEDLAERRRACPHAPAGGRARRRVVAAYHQAAVRARVHQPRAGQLGPLVGDHLLRAEGAVEAGEHDGPERGGLHRGDPAEVVGGEHGLRGAAGLPGRKLSGQGGFERGRLPHRLEVRGRGAVQRELADPGRGGEPVGRGGRDAPGGGAGRRRRRGARRAAAAGPGQVDDEEHDQHDAKHGPGKVDESPRPVRRRPGAPGRGPAAAALAAAGGVWFEAAVARPGMIVRDQAARGLAVRGVAGPRVPGLLIVGGMLRVAGRLPVGRRLAVAGRLAVALAVTRRPVVTRRLPVAVAVAGRLLVPVVIAGRGRLLVALAVTRRLPVAVAVTGRPAVARRLPVAVVVAGRLLVPVVIAGRGRLLVALAVTRRLPVAVAVTRRLPVAVAVTGRPAVGRSRLAALRLVVAWQCSAPRATGPVGGGLAATVVLLLRPAGLPRLLAGVPAARAGVPTTHLRSIPRRCGR